MAAEVAVEAEAVALTGLMLARWVSEELFDTSSGCVIRCLRGSPCSAHCDEVMESVIRTITLAYERRARRRHRPHEDGGGGGGEAADEEMGRRCVERCWRVVG